MFLLHFSRFKTFLFFGHSKIKVRSCVLCVYAGTPLYMVDEKFLKKVHGVKLLNIEKAYVGGAHFYCLTQQMLL